MTMNLWRGLLATLILTLTTHSATASVFENASPNDEQTRLVRVTDPFDFNFPPFTLLLTNNTGYKLQCADINTLAYMLEGFGLDPNAISLMETLSIGSSEVVNSQYESNPVLNCNKGNEDLYIVEYPNGEHKYFIDFLNGNNLNMVGCQGMLDVMGFDIHDAIPLDYQTAQSRFYDIDDQHDIHCISGVFPLIDSDNDGVTDDVDAFPFDANESSDMDGDGKGDNIDTDVDGDGVLNDIDVFPFDTNEWLDTDQDGKGNNSDPDDDNDSVLDTNDAFPLDSSESKDTDLDGVGDNADAFPIDPSETLDTDGDGIGNNTDDNDDGDLFSDLEEIQRNTNPIQYDRIWLSELIHLTQDQEFAECLYENMNNRAYYWADEVTELYCTSDGINNVGGTLEHLLFLTKLDLSNNQLEALDLSQNTALVYLSVQGNKLTSINLNKNTKLGLLNLDSNLFSEIDLSHNIQLWHISMNGNNLTHFDLSNNHFLSTLYLQDNNLTSAPLGLADIYNWGVHIDISGNPWGPEAVAQMSSLWDQYYDFRF